uniref:Glyoxal oxidase n=1 Tax=Kwoniella dejecticola CBS 10117 TaxID=1296121 RepID=A0A1A5ZU19_9TREE|nr:glyoxal oxidase [Kwoniella dejecticola CBS 10117]OBR81304.1 glyoxal oxidase [Kwoniella dejecticola CBS 10117]
MPLSPSVILHVLSLTALSVAPSLAQAQTPNTFKYVGLSGVSAQQLFLGTLNKVYIVDKTENNNATVNGHPAWATEYDLTTNEFRTMDVLSNSFCAGGTVLGNGTWLNVGGNQAITYNGVAMPNTQQTGQSPYKDWDGGKAIRLIDPCDDESCEWVDNPAMYMTSRRWYPTLETLEDGSAMIMGGCEWGGYVNYADNQNNPTVEYFPSKGTPFTLNFLLKTMPVNLFPLVWLLPSGNMLVQAEFQAEIFDYKNNIEYPIADIPDCVRVYPASAGTAVFPMTPENNWTATIIFCGGTFLEADQWTTTWAINTYPANQSCVKITPDVDLNWYHEDPLDTGRSMGNFINLPDGRLFYVNGAHLGTAGYGPEDWTIGQSYADQPVYQSWYFDPKAAAGSKWSKAAVSPIPRMYHSVASLLPDGSVIVSGSNPNADCDKELNTTYTYFTQYQVEIFYPDYWGKTKPNPTGMPTQLTYGGDPFDIHLTLADLDNSAININKTRAVIIRTGFSTHTMNMGQRHVELDTSFTTQDDGGAILHVAQVEPNPAILVPGPALFFIVVNGVPSNASWVTIGDGIIGQQTIKPRSVLPRSQISAQLMAQYGGYTGRSSYAVDTSASAKRVSVDPVYTVQVVVGAIIGIISLCLFNL